MADFLYGGILVADATTFQRATNASCTVYDVNDTGNTTPLALKDPNGLPIPNPVMSTSDAFIPPMIAPSEGVKIVGGGLTVVVYSHIGIKNEAVAAKNEAAGAKAAAEAAAAEAAAAASLVGAPADTAIATAINASGSATKTALSATILDNIETEATATNGVLKNAFRRRRQPGQARWNLLALDRGTRKLTGVMIGTSTVSGTGASPITKRAASLLEKILQASYNPTGIPGGYMVRGTDSGWVNGSSVGTSTNGLGMTTRTVTAPSAIRYDAPLTSGFDLYYEAGASFTVQIDSEPVIPITATTRGVWSSRVLTRGAHSLRILPDSGTAAIDQMYVRDGDEQYGVRLFNAGLSGGQTSDFLASTADPMWARMALLDPDLVPIALGANDYRFQVPIATYKANLQAIINKVNTAATGAAPWIPLLGFLEREIPITITIPYSEYLKAAQEVADANPANVSFHDISGYFPRPGEPDPYNLVNADGVHPDPAGHALIADLLAQEWELPSIRIASATPPAAEALVTWTTITSDGFSGDGAMAGRAADLSGGGSAATWAETVANTLATSGGRLTFGSNAVSGLTYVPTTATNIRASVKVHSSATGGLWYLIAMRTDLSASTALQLRAVFTNMNVKLGKVISGTASDLSASYAVAAGDLVQVEKMGSTIKLLINGVVKETVTDSSVTSNAYAGIANSSGGGSLSLDDFKIESGA